MPDSEIIYVDKMPDFRLTPEGVEVTYSSGQRSFTFFLSRHKVRNLNAVVRQLLDEADRKQQGSVASIKRGKKATRSHG